MGEAWDGSGNKTLLLRLSLAVWPAGGRSDGAGRIQGAAQV